MKPLLCVLLAALIGCDDGQSTPSETDMRADASPADAGDMQLDGTPPDASPIDMEIGPAGGEITANGARLQVPAGALAEPVQLTVRPLPADGTIGAVLEFGPSGLQFAVPARLVIDLPADPPSHLAIAVQVAGEWTALPALEAPAGQIAAEVAHFSRFGIIEVAPDADPRVACGLEADIVASCNGGPVDARCEEYYTGNTSAQEVEDSCDGEFIAGGCPTDLDPPRQLMGICRSPVDGPEIATASFFYTNREDPTLLRAELDGAIRGCEARGWQFCQVIDIPDPEPQPDPEPDPDVGPNACTPDGFTASCPFPGANSCTDYHQGYAVETLQQVCNGMGGNPSFSDTPCDQAGAFGKCEAATLPGQNCATTWFYPPADPALSRQICQGRWTDL